MLTYNNPTDTTRADTKPLSVEENERVVSLLNHIVAIYEDRAHSIMQGNKDLLQRFINHYANMEHRCAVNSGGWRTDTPPPETDMLVKTLELGNTFYMIANCNGGRWYTESEEAHYVTAWREIPK